jgi:hypothetical protein
LFALGIREIREGKIKGLDEFLAKSFAYVRWRQDAFEEGAATLKGKPSETEAGSPDFRNLPFQKGEA